MKYRIKINFADSFDVYDAAEADAPIISNVKLKDSTSLGSNITIGSAVSKMISFTLKNAPVEVFDGQRLTLYGQLDEDMTPDVDFTEYGLTDEQVLNDLFEPVNDDIPDGGIEFTPEEVAAIEESFAQDGETDTYEIPFEDETDNDFVETGDNDVYREDDISAEDVGDATEEDEDYISFGEFYITNIQVVGDEYNIQALDGFILMNSKYVPTNNVDTVENMYNDFRTQLSNLTGIETNEEEEYPDLTIIWDYDTTYREAAGYFAGLLGGYATFDRYGALDIRQYMKNNTLSIIDTDIVDLQLNSDSIVFIQGMICDTDITALTNYVKTSADAEDYWTINFTNPFMTQTILNNIYTTYYENLEYTPAKAILDWTDGIQAGDLINIEDNWILITNQTIDFASGTTTIDSLGTTATLSEGQIEDPTTRKIQRVQKLLADEIEASRIETEQLVAQKADINFANVIEASIGTEWVQKLLVKGNVIANNGTVYELDAIHFNTNFIEAGSIKADKLILKSSTDGLYYQLNINADGFDIDALTEEERAKLPDSLHADVIMANTITTKHITVQNLEGTNGWINLAEGTFRYINQNGNGISWDGNELYIKANDLILESGLNASEVISAVWKDYNIVWTGIYDDTVLQGQVFVYHFGEDITDQFSDAIFSWARKTDYGQEVVQERSKTFSYDQANTLISDTFVLLWEDGLEEDLADENGDTILVTEDGTDYTELIGLEGIS